MSYFKQAVLPAGMEIIALVSVALPVRATSEQVKEWLEFELGARHDISLDNPLHVFDVEASEINWGEGKEPK